MTIVLVDHNMEGQALLLWGTLAAEGWLEFLSARLLTFRDIELSIDSSDREVWRYSQDHRMLLLTANRSRKGTDSLEQTIREENTPTSLPVITVSAPVRMDEKGYRESCAIRLVEILLDVEAFLGTGRLYIP